MEENNEIKSDDAEEKKDVKKNPHVVMTVWTSVALSVMFVLDLVLFMLNMLAWYVFVALLAIYLIIFPIALLVIFKSGKKQSTESLTAEVEAELAAEAAAAPDLTQVYEE